MDSKAKKLGIGNKRKNMEIENLSEAMRVAIETKEKEEGPGCITQLVKPRPPALWSGQKFDR